MKTKPAKPATCIAGPGTFTVHKTAVWRNPSMKQNKYTCPHCGCEQDLPPRPPIGTRVRHPKRGKGVVFSHDQCDELSCGVDYGKRGQWCEAIRELLISP